MAREKTQLRTIVSRWTTARFAAPAWTAFIVLICAIPGSELPAVEILEVDKLVHIAVFFVFAVLWSTRAQPAPLALLVAGGVALASFTELLQGLAIPGRSSDPYDVVADVIGLLIGTAWIRTRGWSREQRRM